MSSVARYSPVYNDPPATTGASVTEFNPVVIHQLVSSEESSVQNEQFVDINNSSLNNMSTVLCNNDLREVSSQYLHMVQPSENDIVSTNSTEELQLVPEREQKVELLITDEATGKISV